MRPVKTHTFRKTKYDIGFSGPINGSCEGKENVKNPKLSVYTDLKAKLGLETVIHEALHACCFAKTEEIVSETAYDIARFLWRLGYRKVE